MMIPTFLMCQQGGQLVPTRRSARPITVVPRSEETGWVFKDPSDIYGIVNDGLYIYI